MERALQNRLTYGPLMLGTLIGLLLLDRYVEAHTGGMFASLGGRGVKGVGLLLILLAITPPAVMELARLFAAVQVRPYRLIASVGCSVLVLHAFAMQFPRLADIGTSTLALILVFVMFFAALRRARLRQAQQAIHHMAGTVLATLYLGVQAWFLMALRVKESNHFTGTILSILMILLVVKSTDIGAFFEGKGIGASQVDTLAQPRQDLGGPDLRRSHRGGRGGSLFAMDARLNVVEGRGLRAGDRRHRPGRRPVGKHDETRRGH